MKDKQEFMALVGRALVAHVFIVASVMKLMNFAATAGFMTSLGVPFAPVLLGLSLPIELACGVMIVVGWQARWAALTLAVWLVVVTPIFHAFWGLDPIQTQNQMNHFMKNVSILGALLFIAAMGPGGYSVEALRTRRSGVDGAAIASSRRY